MYLQEELNQLSISQYEIDYEWSTKVVKTLCYLIHDNNQVRNTC